MERRDFNKLIAGGLVLGTLDCVIVAAEQPPIPILPHLYYMNLREGRFLIIESAVPLDTKPETGIMGKYNLMTLDAKGWEHKERFLYSKDGVTALPAVTAQQGSKEDLPKFFPFTVLEGDEGQILQARVVNKKQFIETSDHWYKQSKDKGSITHIAANPEK